MKKIFLHQKRHYDYDDTEHKWIRDVRNLFDLSIDEDYYKPIKANDSFNNSYIEYEILNIKTLSIKEYLDIIRLYLSDIINDSKTQGNGKCIQAIQ